MNLATIFERIRKVTVEQLSVNEEEVTPSSSFVDDLGADSLDLVELIMALEEEFTTPERKVSIPDEDAEKIITVQDAMDYIRELGVSDSEAAKAAIASKPAQPKPTTGAPSSRPTTSSKPSQIQRPPQGGKSSGNRPQGQRPPQRQGQSLPHCPQSQNQPPRKPPAPSGPQKPSSGTVA